MVTRDNNIRHHWPLRRLSLIRCRLLDVRTEKMKNSWEHVRMHCLQRTAPFRYVTFARTSVSCVSLCFPRTAMFRVHTLYNGERRVALNFGEVIYSLYGTKWKGVNWHHGGNKLQQIAIQPWFVLSSSISRYWLARHDAATSCCSRPTHTHI